MRSRARHPVSLVGAWLLCGLVVGLPLARGGVQLPFLVASISLSTAALLTALWDEPRIPVPAIGLLATAILVLAQSLPAPPAVHQLFPATHRTFHSVLGPLQLYPGWRPLSLDPYASWKALGGAATWLLAFCAAWLAGSGRRRRALLISAVALAGVGSALAHLGAALLGSTPLLAPHVPFVNPNHLASLLVLSAPVCLGLALQAHRQARLLWLVAFVVTAACVFLSLSRGGMAALLLGTVLFLALRLWAGEPARKGPGPRLVALAAGATGCALAIAAFLALDPLLGEARTLRTAAEENKIALWRPALDMVRDHPLIGVGRGAFETAFPAYKQGAEQVTYTYLENEWLQAAVELGVPGALLLSGTLLLAWWSGLRRNGARWENVGLLSGTAALAVHNVVDFSLQLPGVAVPFVVALALAARAGPSLRLTRALALTSFAALAALGLGGVLAWKAEAVERRNERIMAANTPSEALAAARLAIDARPVDFVPPAAAGARLVGAGRCAEAMPWLSRSMLLNPTAPEPHLLAGRCLAAAGLEPFALREYRLAVVFGHRGALQEAAARFPSVAALLRVAPDSPDGLLSLGSFLEAQRPADAATVYRLALEQYGDDRALLPLARSLRVTGQTEQALALAGSRTTSAPTDAGAWRLVAELLLTAGDEAAALEAARRGLIYRPGSPELITFLFDRAMEQRQFSEARRLADQVAARTPAESAWRLQLAARALAAQGRYPEAIDLARSAAGILPGSAAPLMNLATYLGRVGRYEEALDAVGRADGTPDAPKEALTALRTRLVADQSRSREAATQPGPSR